MSRAENIRARLPGAKLTSPETLGFWYLQDVEALFSEIDRLEGELTKAIDAIQVQAHRADDLQLRLSFSVSEQEKKGG